MTETAVPTASYRLQLQPGFGFAEAGQAVPHLARLGVSHLHLSPVLQAVPGSTHGYDVTDHGRISEQLGGEAGLRALAATAHGHGLHLIVDTVPNHMAAPVPAHLNRAWWELLRSGPDSPSARWFDVDWAAQDGRLLLPVLGAPPAEELSRITVDREADPPLLHYYDHVLPLRPGTEQLPLPALLDAQWYRLAWWRTARTELNYRRFFTVSDLVGLRVEHEEVFAATHALLLRLHAEGIVDGLRIDHPDGLADPRGYLRRLAAETGGAYVVVEKILTGEERLPEDWACAGTTGYDALRRIDGVLTDGAGVAALTAVYAEHLGLPGPEAVPGADAFALDGRAEMVAPEGELAAEVNRLTRVAASALNGTAPDGEPPLRGAVAAALAAYPVYRPYPVPGEEDRPADAAALADAAEGPLLDLALGRLGRGPARDEFRTRFAQTASAVAAKGVEDTAFYRRFPLLSLNEVGGDPARPGLAPEEFHAYCERMQRDWPHAMTALSTHDTKRSADARARLAVLAELPELWRTELATLTALLPDPPPDPATGYLLWQTALAAWPIDGDRLSAAVLKSVREAKQRTSWTEPDQRFEQAVERTARAVPESPEIRARLDALVAGLAPWERVNTLSGTLLHLTMPGVPDLYQGSELPLHTLVDPDNRRIVDFATVPVPGTTAAEKLHVTTVALRLRRRLPGSFAAGYTPVPADRHLVAFRRGPDVLAAATRLPHGLARRGGWGRSALRLPSGSWTELLTGRAGLRDAVALADLLAALPVALLVRDSLRPGGGSAGPEGS